jgi:hypothetical protein
VRDAVRFKHRMIVSEAAESAFRAGHARVIEVGGRLLKAADDPAVPSGFRAYADPAVTPSACAGSRRRPRPS